MRADIDGECRADVPGGRHVTSGTDHSPCPISRGHPASRRRAEAAEPNRKILKKVVRWQKKRVERS
jgi:hypothetical protein